MSISCSFGLWFDISVKDLGFFFLKRNLMVSYVPLYALCMGLLIAVFL